MWFQSLDWEDSLEKGMATHSSILAWENPLDRGVAGYRVTKSHTRTEATCVHEPQAGHQKSRGQQMTTVDHWKKTARVPHLLIEPRRMPCSAYIENFSKGLREASYIL